MSAKLFLGSVECVEGKVLLGFTAGTPVAMADSRKLRDLGDGLAEYSVTVSAKGGRFDVRTVTDRAGCVVKVIASSEPIPDDWHEDANRSIEEQAR
jgi:hypothetical protein